MSSVHRVDGCKARATPNPCHMVELLTGENAICAAEPQSKTPLEADELVRAQLPVFDKRVWLPHTGNYHLVPDLVAQAQAGTQQRFGDVSAILLSVLAAARGTQRLAFGLRSGWSLLFLNG